MVAGVSGYLRGGLVPVAKNRPKSRLFFATFPDASAAQDVSRLAVRLREDYGLQGMPLSPKRLHVTLRFLGDYLAIPESLVGSARSAANDAKLSPFKVAFDRVTSFDTGSRQRPLVLVASAGLVELSGLHQKLGSYLEGIGGTDTEAGRIYVPHLTLLHDSRQLEVSLPEPIEWTVSEFFLVESSIGQSTYVVLERWALSR